MQEAAVWNNSLALPTQRFKQNAPLAVRHLTASKASSQVHGITGSIHNNSCLKDIAHRGQCSFRKGQGQSVGMHDSVQLRTCLIAHSLANFGLWWGQSTSAAKQYVYSFSLPAWSSVRAWLLRLHTVFDFAPAHLPAADPVLHMSAPVRRGAVADARLGLA